MRRAGRGGELLERTTEVVEKDDGTVVTRTTERWTAPDWRANAWWLERQFPEEFAKAEGHEVSGPDGGPIFLAVGELYRRDPEARAAGLLLAQRSIEAGALDGGVATRVESTPRLRWAGLVRAGVAQEQAQAQAVPEAGPAPRCCSFTASAPRAPISPCSADVSPSTTTSWPSTCRGTAGRLRYRAGTR